MWTRSNSKGAQSFRRSSVSVSHPAVFCVASEPTPAFYQKLAVWLSHEENSCFKASKCTFWLDFWNRMSESLKPNKCQGGQRNKSVAWDLFGAARPPENGWPQISREALTCPETKPVVKHTSTCSRAAQCTHTHSHTHIRTEPRTRRGAVPMNDH